MTKIKQRILLLGKESDHMDAVVIDRWVNLKPLSHFWVLIWSYSWVQNSSLRLQHGSGAILHMGQIELEVILTQINLHWCNQFKNNALLTNLLDLYLQCFSNSDIMTVTDVEDNVGSSDPEPMWESESISASIFQFFMGFRKQFGCHSSWHHHTFESNGNHFFIILTFAVTI